MPLPFHPHDPSFNRANALYLAHASDIAYHRSPSTAAHDRLGLKAVAFRDKITRTRGFLGVCDTHAILAFRGSDPVTLPNWVTDLVVRLVQRTEYDGRVHQGFSSVLRRSWSKIEKLLEHSPGKPLFLTGHSMGGALAILTACRLAKSGRPPIAIYTFGAPRVGDPAFCAAYSLPTYRLVNHLDPVPETPLASVSHLLPKKPRFTNEKILRRLQQLAEQTPCYAHVNTFIHIKPDGSITTDPNLEPWHTHAFSRAIATRGKNILDGLTDHMIANYIRALEGQPRKKQSPLTTSKSSPSRRRMHDRS